MVEAVRRGRERERGLVLSMWIAAVVFEREGRLRLYGAYVS